LLSPNLKRSDSFWLETYLPLVSLFIAAIVVDDADTVDDAPVDADVVAVSFFVVDAVAVTAFVVATQILLSSLLLLL